VVALFQINYFIMKTKLNLLLILGLPFGIFSQNTCSTAIPITAGIYTVAVIDGSEAPTPICAGNGPVTTNPAGEWYVYTPTDDYTVTVSTDLSINAGGDTRFHVYTGTCGALVCHAGDDDGGSGFLSVSTFSVITGVTYYIAFDNKWSSNGFDFELSESFLPPPIPAPVTFTGNTIPSISGTYQIAVADMNNDYLDDIVTVSSSSIQIHYQQAGGGFTNTTISTTDADFPPSWSLAVGDFDKNRSEEHTSELQSLRT
jgi:hypothetical protein